MKQEKQTTVLGLYAQRLYNIKMLITIYKQFTVTKIYKYKVKLQVNTLQNSITFEVGSSTPLLRDFTS